MSSSRSLRATGSRSNRATDGVDFLCILRISRDAPGQAICAVAVRGDEALRRGRLVEPEGFHKLMVLIGMPFLSAAHTSSSVPQ